MKTMPLTTVFDCKPVSIVPDAVGHVELDYTAFQRHGLQSRFPGLHGICRKEAGGEETKAAGYAARQRLCQILNSLVMREASGVRRIPPLWFPASEILFFAIFRSDSKRQPHDSLFDLRVPFF